MIFDKACLDAVRSLYLFIRLIASFRAMFRFCCIFLSSIRHWAWMSDRKCNSVSGGHLSFICGSGLEEKWGIGDLWSVGWKYRDIYNRWGILYRLFIGTGKRDFKMGAVHRIRYKRGVMLWSVQQESRYTAIWILPQLQIFYGNKTGGARKGDTPWVSGGNAGRRKAAGGSG